MNPLNKLFALLSLLTVASQASAVLVERDLASAGDKQLTFDTKTRLEWLDVSNTIGETLEQVQSGSYLTTLGFRFATLLEVETLWRNAGATGPIVYDPNHESYAENYLAAKTLVGMLGCISYVLGVQCDNFEQNWHIARFSLQSGPIIQELGLVDYFETPDPRIGTGAMLINVGSSFPSFYSRPDIGNYLVRTPIPESSTLAYMLLGFTLSLRQYKKQFKNAS